MKVYKPAPRPIFNPFNRSDVDTFHESHHYFNSESGFIEMNCNRLTDFGDDNDSLTELLSRPKDMQGRFKAVVDTRGFVSLHLKHNINVDIAPNQTVRILNPKQQSSLCLSGCGTQLSLVHPQGRLIQYNNRLEYQTRDSSSIKYAKMWSKGISFSSSKSVIVYIVDVAGCRSTVDNFHDLYYENIANSMFWQGVAMFPEPMTDSMILLEEAKYWKEKNEMLNCWSIGDIFINQTKDGLVSVKRRCGTEWHYMKASPSNGKVKLQTSLLYATASLGKDAHMFIRSKDRRLHCNENCFRVRNAGHSAGYDENNILKLW